MLWRIDGERVYKVKGKRKSRKKSFKSKLSALRSLHKRRK
jgi:hypothetical protein